MIDPVLSYSSYLGGSGFDSGFATVDASGNVLVTGTTSSRNFPTTAGAYQGGYRGDTSDVFVTKLNATGTALIYSTFLGGSGFDSGGGAADASGNVLVTGATSSRDFPTTVGAYQRVYGGGTSDVFVTKLNATGTALVYSTFLGGSDADTGFGVTDASGNVYVTGFTSSSNFPTTAGAFQTVYGGGLSDAFVTKLNASGTALVYSTFLGGSDADTGFGVTDASGNVYVTGTTASGNFPTTADAYQRVYGGGSSDAFVTKLNATGTALVYSTYLGGSDGDSGIGFAFDSSGNVYVTGFTSSSNFPTTPGAYQTVYGGGASDLFVVKFSGFDTPQILASDCFFNWAERNYPAFFAPANATSSASGSIYYRYYSQTQAYLATYTVNNHVYYPGPLSGYSIVDLGPLSSFLSTAGCE